MEIGYDLTDYIGIDSCDNCGRDTPIGHACDYCGFIYKDISNPNCDIDDMLTNYDLYEGPCFCPNCGDKSDKLLTDECLKCGYVPNRALLEIL